MANDILAFQSGREAAIAGLPRDKRRSADWLEGYGQIKGETHGRSVYAPSLFT